MKNPAVYISPDTTIERAIIELQELAIAHREHILRLEGQIGQLAAEHRKESDRTERRFEAARKELDRLKGVHGV